MRSLRITCMFILCAASVFLTGLPCEAAPRLQLDQDIYDAGRVPQGKDVTHEFIFRNAGDKALLIKPKAC